MFIMLPAFEFQLSCGCVTHLYCNNSIHQLLQYPALTACAKAIAVAQQSEGFGNSIRLIGKFWNWEISKFPNCTFPNLFFSLPDHLRYFKKLFIMQRGIPECFLTADRTLHFVFTQNIHFICHMQQWRYTCC